MPYLGNQPDSNFTTTTVDTFNGNNSDTQFPLSRSATTNDVEVFVENVQQQPTTAYSISGTTITFTSPPPTGTGNIYVIHRGAAITSPTPPANSITNAMMQDDAIGLAELSATGTPSSSSYLRGDNTWAALSTTFEGLTDTTVSTSDPTITTNPSATGHLWLNKTSGEVYVCIDATTDANVWANVGLGTTNILGPYDIEYVLVAGGGGAGATQSNYDAGTGGGGGGGYKSSVSGESSGGGTSALSPITVEQSDVVTIVIGGGGAGQTANTHNRGVAGTDSTLAVTGQSTITSIGGGGGGSSGADTLDEAAGGSGGSGGGATSYNSLSRSGGSGTAGQGFDGGDLVFSTSTYNGAGGGGAGSEGSDAINNGGTLVGGDGGSGVTSSITGTGVGRAGGGGGGGRSNDASGTGTDGAGSGGPVPSGPFTGNGEDGDPNTGGGGGGAYGNSTQNGGSGGSGVCILKIPTVYYSGTYTGNDVVKSTVGDYTILQFNDSGSYTA